MTTSRAMQSLAIAPSGAPLSKEQKSFNQLLNKIETQRKLLQEWEDATVSFRQKYATELKPLAQQCSELRVRFIHLLHGMHPQKGLTRRDREDLSELIAQLAEGEMLQAGDDAELKAIFEFHADMEPGELDASDRQGFESFKAMFEAEFGVPLDDSIHMDSSFQDLQRVMARAMADKLAAEGAAQPDADTAGAAHQQPKPRKKSAKTLAKEAAQAQEEQQISLSIREVYRKLASALHPDREPDLLARQAAFDRGAWRAGHGIAAGALAVSLFCYEPAALEQALQLPALAHAHWLVAPGRAQAAMQQACTRLAQVATVQQHALAHVPQPAFDELLWACDVNFVRGEDSLVRALWAGQPFVWHIYPQDDNAHHAKLDAFLDWLQAPPSLRAFHHVWNGVRPGPLPDIDLPSWTACAQTARQRLLVQDDLVTQLLRLVTQKR